MKINVTYVNLTIVPQWNINDRNCFGLLNRFLTNFEPQMLKKIIIL